MVGKYERVSDCTVREGVGEVIGAKLCPTQLGYGTPEVCETAIHVTQRYLSQVSGMLPRVL